MSDETPSEATYTCVSVAPLFEPMPFGRVTLPNRIAMAPMTREQSPGKVANEINAAYYRRRAEGGVGLIITEGTNPSHPASGASDKVPAIHGDEALAGWKKVIGEVHDAGSFIIPQLWHLGSMRRKGLPPEPDVPGFAPSPVLHPGAAQLYGDKAEVPHEMTQKDIGETVESFARAAKDAEDIGFDGIELHAAHSYLIDQFFWEVTNQRTDKYGGKTAPERLRFALEIVEACRAQVSDDFPIVFRFSQWKQGDYVHKMVSTPDELGAFLQPLADAGVDWFHASTRRFDTPEFEGSNLNLAGWAKELTGKPSMTVGSVGLDLDFLHSYAGEASAHAGLDSLMERFNQKEFDIVAVGRALMSDPAWANKVKESRENEIEIFGPKHLQIYH